MARARNGKLKGLAAQARKLELHRIREVLRDIERKLGTFEEEEDADRTAPALDGLDERDLEFLRLLRHKDNYSYVYISLLMDIPLPTVHHVRSKLFKLFGVRSKIELVRLLDEQDGEPG